MFRWMPVPLVAVALACSEPGKVSGWPAELETVSPGLQVGLAGSPVNDAPSVQLLDVDGKPIVGAKITFAATVGAGGVGGPVATTDENGIATVAAWSLGAGANELTASIPAPYRVPPVTFSATGVAAAYHIEVAFLTPTSPARQAVFTGAAARWEQLVYGELQDIVNIPADLCFTGQPAIPFVDDMLIHVFLDSIDGPGGVLGGAGPCFIRIAGKLPLHGVMVFDTADVAELEADGQFDEVVRHEMAHVMGYGSIWTPPPNLLNLLAGGGGPDPFFTGTHARAVFDRIGGTAYTGGGKVPVEDQGGSGTRDVHWRESVFDNELMTGFLNSGVPNPLSIVTVASFRDEGYLVNYSAADAYTQAFSAALRGPPAERGARALGNDILPYPIHVVDATGRVIGLFRRAP